MSLIDKALAGEEVIITRHGKPVVALQVVSPMRRPKPDTAKVYGRLRTLRESLPAGSISSVDLIRQIRDEGID